MLRHSFASLAGDFGYSEPTIATLIGHKGRTITSRYVHAADAVLLAAADAVANRTAQLMGGPLQSCPIFQLQAFEQIGDPIRHLIDEHRDDFAQIGVAAKT